MGRSQETFNKKEVRRNKEKKRKAKEKKKEARKDGDKGNVDDMIAYVDANGMITSIPPDPDKKEDVDIEDIEISVPKRDPSLEVDTVRTGTVSFYNDSKGYGFIRDSVTKESIFVHVNNVEEEIKEGNAVSFEVVKGQKGPTAVEVKVLKQ
jgi:cold shock CspA family protein